MSETKISYATHKEFPWHGEARQYLLDIIERYGASHLLEIGSGAAPTLLVDDVQRLGLRYVTNDESEEELAKAPAGFDTLAGDMTRPELAPDQSFDLIFSRMVNEHVADGAAYYRNIYRLLQPGGVTVHLFSTLYALPFVVNRTVPGWLSDRLLRAIHPWNVDNHAEKFRAHYSWSRGPTAASLSRLRSVGFDVVEYHGYFGHGYYARRLGPLDRVEQWKARRLVKHPVPWLTAYAAVVLRRPLS